ncbi:MAG: DNA translocase FtsK 4TM domain-containing protein, partial [Verrucomicrobiota bacterium]
MARKDSNNTPATRGFSDTIGIALIASALLLMIALVTHDRRDLPANSVPPNETMHNLGGPIGAWVADKMFFVFGAGAFVAPLLMFVFGLGYLFQFLSYLRHRWIWAAVLFMTTLGLLGFYSSWFPGLHESLNTEAGGLVGMLADKYIRKPFGLTGATIIFLTLYLLALLNLTNFQLGEWLREKWTPGLALDPNATPEEKELAKRKRELEKEERKLQQEAAKAEKAVVAGGPDRLALGTDGLPVPQPVVRDLSVPQAKPGARIAKTKSGEMEKIVAPIEEIIPAEEVKAATTADILGKPVAKLPETKPAENGSPEMPNAPTDANGNLLPEPIITTAPRPRLLPKRPKPIMVAQPTSIG